MNILLTGGGELVDTNLIPRLLSEGDLVGNGLSDQPATIRPFRDPECWVVHGDIRRGKYDA